MNTLKKGTCVGCQKSFMYSIGSPNLPRDKESVTPTILDWFNEIGKLCYQCAPIPTQFQDQVGVIVHREVIAVDGYPGVYGV